MNAAWLAILRRFGQDVRVFSDGTWSGSRAFLQPVRSSAETLPAGFTPLGWNDSRRWLCLGKDVLQEGALLEWNGLRFSVVSGRAVFFGNQPCYWRALLEPLREVIA